MSEENSEAIAVESFTITVQRTVESKPDQDEDGITVDIDSVDQDDLEANYRDDFAGDLHENFKDKLSENTDLSDSDYDALYEKLEARAKDAASGITIAIEAKCDEGESIEGDRFNSRDGHWTESEGMVYTESVALTVSLPENAVDLGVDKEFIQGHVENVKENFSDYVISGDLTDLTDSTEVDFSIKDKPSALKSLLAKKGATVKADKQGEQPVSVRSPKRAS
jgi:hypothetical protein